jgi:hypothetical protein
VLWVAPPTIEIAPGLIAGRVGGHVARLRLAMLDDSVIDLGTFGFQVTA